MVQLESSPIEIKLEWRKVGAKGCVCVCVCVYDTYYSRIKHYTRYTTETFPEHVQKIQFSSELRFNKEALARVGKKLGIPKRVGEEERMRESAELPFYGKEKKTKNDVETDSLTLLANSDGY